MTDIQKRLLEFFDRIMTPVMQRMNKLGLQKN